jgi:hypothetical protein
MKTVKNRLGQEELQTREYVPPGPVLPKARLNSPIPARPEAEVRSTSKCPHCGKDIASETP